MLRKLIHKVAGHCYDLDHYQTAPISEADRVMLDYVAQLNRDATRISKPTTSAGEIRGSMIREFLQITLIASWFNYINRVADALGVGRDGD